MKKIFRKIFILPAAGLMLLGSCAKKIDEAYLNPNAPIRVPVASLLPNILANMAISYTAQGTNYGPQNDIQYVARYVQYWATNTTLNQYDRMGGATGASDILGSVWAGHYYGMGQNLEKMIEWAEEEKKYDFVGVGKIIRAWSWLTLTDMYDEVILKDAFDIYKLVFKYDKPEEVYEEVKRLAREGLNYLDRTDGNNDPAALAMGDAYGNGGDLNKWRKLANAVMARTFHRYANKTTYKPDSVIHYANLAMNSNAENTNITFAADRAPNNYSYYSPARGNVGTLRQTKFMADLMSGLNTGIPTAMVDPRAPYLIRENPAGEFKGVRPTKGADGLTATTGPSNFWGGSFTATTAPASDAGSRYLFTHGPKWPVATASEMAFLKAEAYYKMGEKDDARMEYLRGINLNFDQLIADYEQNVPNALRITQDDRDDYLANEHVTVDLADFNLTHIMLQKYIALYIWGSIETWVDMRRYEYVKVAADNNLKVYRDFEPPSGTDLWPDNNGELIYRARPRYNSEYLYNIAELERIGALALNYQTKKPWFVLP